jgi:hypothetical protein
MKKYCRTLIEINIMAGLNTLSGIYTITIIDKTTSWKRH